MCMKIEVCSLDMVKFLELVLNDKTFAVQGEMLITLAGVTQCK